MERYHKAVDFGKILAIAGVLMIHLFYRLPSLYPYKDYTQIGANGVAMFFVISGFTIMQSVERNKEKTYKTFYKRRIVRLIPLYYFLLLVDIIIRLVGILPVLPEDMYHLGYLRYVLFLNTVIPSNDIAAWNNLHHTWTMSCFAFFYCLAPFLYKICMKWYYAFGLWGICWLTSKMLPFLCKKYYQEAYERYSFFEQFLDWTPVKNLYVFLYGVLLFFAVKQGWELILGMLCSMEIIFLLIFGHYTGFLFWGSVSVLFLIIVSKVDMQNLKIRNMIKKLGAGSFSLYLSHGLVIDLFQKISDNVIVMLFLILLTGFLVYEFIEKRLTDWLKKMIKC